MPPPPPDTKTPDTKSIVVDAIKKAFGAEISPTAADDAVRRPFDDQGNWAPNALVVVYLEYGLPDVFDDAWSAPYWDAVEKDLSATLGFEVYFESVNAAVSALYRVVPLRSDELLNIIAAMESLERWETQLDDLHRFKAFGEHRAMGCLECPAKQLSKDMRQLRLKLSEKRARMGQ